MSNFKSDLSKEKLLGNYLDTIYPTFFSTSGYSVERISDLTSQHKGIDLILKKGDINHFVDEKAQLDYLNKSLPTFAFELSYLKKKSWCIGWLTDKKKVTSIYFLITGIHTRLENSLESGISKIKVTGVYRDKLLSLLKEKGLDSERLYEIENLVRTGENQGKIPINELDTRQEGYIYFSKNNKWEQPINLVLKLDFLLRNKIGKVLFEK